MHANRLLPTGKLLRSKVWWNSENVKCLVPPVTASFFLQDTGEMKQLVFRWVGKSVIYRYLAETLGKYEKIVYTGAKCSLLSHPWHFIKNYIHFSMYFLKVRNQLNHIHTSSPLLPRNIFCKFVYKKSDFDFSDFLLVPSYRFYEIGPNTIQSLWVMAVLSFLCRF